MFAMVTSGGDFYSSFLFVCLHVLITFVITNTHKILSQFKYKIEPFNFNFIHETGADDISKLLGFAPYSLVTHLIKCTFIVS